jgi:tRNA (guanine37-N1)-methyltransferase
VSECFRISVVTLFSEFFAGPLEASLLGQAIRQGRIEVTMINPRDFTEDRHRTVDDTPFGGGPGMVLKPEPMVAAIEAARERTVGAPVVLLTPQGETLTAGSTESLAAETGLILVCGRYEGFDERIRDYVDSELSIGDYVLTGGEPAAVVVIDAVSRFRTGVLGNERSLREESFAEGLLEYPQYTRPAEFRGKEVPPVLRSGDHGRIAEWRRTMALERTRRRRPDLMARHVSLEGEKN